MTAMLTPTQTARIKEAAPIEAVVGAYVRLRPNGSDTMTGLCPFHNERTGSLKIHPKAGYYHCFGCGAQGDVIKFIQTKEGVSFGRAARMLADQFGVRLDDSASISRDQLRMAQSLAAESQRWWRRVRMWLVQAQHVIVDCERRAVAFVSARLDAEDSPGIEYAWWWVANAWRLYAWLAGYVLQIDEMPPAEAIAGYAVVRDKVRPIYRREQLMWTAFRDELMAGIHGATRAQ